ncbi:MAG: hypothetical protein STSR0008_18320 [Ignavibacterium sp.]
MFDFKLNRLSIQNRKSSLTIEGIDFKLDEKEKSFAILGDSGMGKTTIFKSLFSRYIQYWALEKKFTFDCLHTYKGKNFNNNDIIKNVNIPLIGFATQSPYFFNTENVSDNLFRPLDWKNKKWTEQNKKEYIKLFEIEDLSTKSIDILSGGQKQLINIARMLVLNPSIAIIDECFSSMNEDMAKKYIDLIKNKFSDIIFLITSHRKTDINHFGCKYITLKKEKYKGGGFYVTKC